MRTLHVADGMSGTVHGCDPSLSVFATMFDQFAPSSVLSSIFTLDMLPLLVQVIL
jgi:hypothetical protein